MNIKLACTGATGFIGTALLQRLVYLYSKDTDFRKSFDLSGISRSVPFQPIEGVRYTQIVDISESIDLSRVLQGVDVLVHTAARVHVMSDNAADSLAEFRRVNVLGTLNLAIQAASVGVRRFVFISSIGVNGLYTFQGSPFTELDIANPHNAYALSKYEAEQCLRSLAAETGMEVVIIRPPLVYGFNAPGNFGSLIRIVKRAWPLPLGCVKNKRSFVALDNLVDFIVTCINHPQAANQTFLVSDGKDLSTADLLQCMGHAAGVPARLFPVPVWALRVSASLFGKGDMVQRLIGNLEIDISKARVLLGWVPPVSVEEGLRRAMGVEFDEKTV